MLILDPYAAAKIEGACHAILIIAPHSFPSLNPSFQTNSRMLSSVRCSFLFALFLSSLVVASEAFTTAALLSGGATAFLYATSAVALGPIGLASFFLGSTLGLQYIGTKIDKETAQQRLGQTEINRLLWTNCSRPAHFSTHHSCRSKRYCEDTIQIHGSYDCNACGANALTARRWTNPLDTSDYSTEPLCMDVASRAIFTPPKVNTPAGFWNCSALPHFHECRRCGAGTAFARYDRQITAAGLQLICVRADATIEQKFV